MRILITGSAGFIGANFVSYFLKQNKNTKIVSLDNLTYAGNKNNLMEVLDNSNHTFILSYKTTCFAGGHVLKAMPIFVL